MDERTEQTRAISPDTEGIAAGNETPQEEAVSPEAAAPVYGFKATGLVSDTRLEDQSAPDPSSRVITPSEVAIAYASGSAIPISATSYIDPGKTNEFPIVTREEVQMPELYADGELPKSNEPISESAPEEQETFTRFDEPEPAIQQPVSYSRYGGYESAAQERPAFDSYDEAQEVQIPTEPAPAIFSPAPIPAVIRDRSPILDKSPVPTMIHEVAQAAVQELTNNSIAVAAPDVLSQEQPFGSMREEPLKVEEEPVERGITVITKEATVLGDILTEGHIDIVGRVKGNIDAKGDVAIHGIVRGDVGGAKIGLYNCRVKGNLDAGLGVIVDDGSIIGGDVKTKNIIFDGKVKGNIDAENVVVLRSHSYCLGDVSAASLAIEPGAILNGKVRTFVEGDLEAPFSEVI